MRILCIKTVTAWDLVSRHCFFPATFLSYILYKSENYSDRSRINDSCIRKGGAEAPPNHSVFLFCKKLLIVSTRKEPLRILKGIDRKIGIGFNTTLTVSEEIL